MNDSQKRAEALRALLRDATEGEWFFNIAHGWIATRLDPLTTYVIAELQSSNDANAALIVGAVNALPDLLDQLDALTAERDRLIVERDAAVRAGMERAAGIAEDCGRFAEAERVKKSDDDHQWYYGGQKHAAMRIAVEIAIRAASIGAGDGGL